MESFSSGVATDSVVELSAYAEEPRGVTEEVAEWISELSTSSASTLVDSLEVGSAISVSPA